MRAIAHGVSITATPKEAIAIEATYDSGTPLAEAQVTIYAPEDPATPWMKGTTDEAGRFVFVPDRDQTGDWAVVVRQAGHGGNINVSVGEAEGETATAESGDGEASTSTAATVSGSGTYTPLQKGFMAGSIVWGFIGTAFFFARRKA